MWEKSSNCEIKSQNSNKLIGKINKADFGRNFIVTQEKSFIESRKIQTETESRKKLNYSILLFE